jgi:hypothetical protein
MESRFAATEFFNSPSENDKKAVLESGLGPEVLYDGPRFAIPIWWLFRDQTGAYGLRNGSAFLIDRGHGV